LHIFLIKKYFSVISSVFDKTWQKQKSKNIHRTVQRIAKKCNVRQFVLSHMHI
jgi:hypothetical protein